MGWLWWVGTAAIIAWLVAIVDIIRGRERFSRGQLAAWILIVIILPVIGTICISSSAADRRRAGRTGV